MTNLIHQSDDSQIKTEMIAICSAVGGAGRTAFTVNLASLLAQHHADVRIIDGDLQFGDVALALDLKPSVSIGEMVARKDLENAAEYCMKHKTGIQVLAAPAKPEQADLITPEILSSITTSLKAGTQFLLVDTEVGLTEKSMQVMEKADRILIVTPPGMAALKNTRLMVGLLAALEMKQKISLIVNKFTTDTVVKANEIPALVQLEQAYFLPNDPKHVSHSLDIGTPVVKSKPKIAYSKEMEQLVDELFPEIKGVKSKQSTSGMLKKWKNSIKGTRGQGDELISKAAIKEPGRS